MKRALIACAVLIIFAIVGNKVVAQTADINIKNCGMAQNYLNNKLRSDDLNSRVDRDQAYQNIYDYLDAIASRLENNKQQDAKNIRQLTDNFKARVNTFINDYETYDQARDKLAKLPNCQNQVKTFESLLADARTKRQQVATDINKINNFMLGSADNQLDDTYQNLLKTGNSGALLQ